MKQFQIQAAFARKRENEALRSSKNLEINHYFDKWNKTTKKYESWTESKYYERAEENMKKLNLEVSKKQHLNERRKKLKEIFVNENFQYDNELKILQKPQSRIKQLSANNLQKINENIQNSVDYRRKLELEAKLYGKLRNGGISDENLLESARSDQEVLAKLNWLDKEIENQMKKEEEEKNFAKYKLLIEEESRKHEEQLKERQEIRKSEIQELRKLQEFHINALKEREQQKDLLQKTEKNLKEIIERINFEADEHLKVKEQKFNQNLLMNNINVHNFKRMKVILRQHSELFRKNLKSDLDFLRRIFPLIGIDGKDNFLQRLETMYNYELKRQSEIESMYESEARQNFQKWLEEWKEKDLTNEQQLKLLLDRYKQLMDDKLIENKNAQKNLIKICEKHLNALENANENLKCLIEEKDYYETLRQQNNSSTSANQNNNDDI